MRLMITWSSYNMWSLSSVIHDEESVVLHQQNILGILKPKKKNKVHKYHGGNLALKLPTGIQ